MAKILIVDDNRVMRKIVKRTLRQAGLGNHEVEECASGPEALNQLKNNRFDLILSDWNMPEMDGLEFLMRVKSAGITTPFGLVTSEGRPELLDKATDAGALFIITKPFTSDQFFHVLSPYLT